MQHVFIVGCKGIPARYGGFETFVENLTNRQISPRIHYHIACLTDESAGTEDFLHNGAHCHAIRRRSIGAANALAYDVEAVIWALKYIRANEIPHPIIYVLACRIGPFIGKFVKDVHSLGGSLIINPDGHEWKRAKWSRPVRWYWKCSESLMVRHADLVVCDSMNIESYIQTRYRGNCPPTTYISYGADSSDPVDCRADTSYGEWLSQHGLRAGSYYLIVGRAVPENNYDIMLREFMSTNSERSLVVVTEPEQKFLSNLDAHLSFRQDDRVQFPGTVYDPSLLKRIREGAFAYLHGHEVGGTNPSLLEALASTKMNLLLDVGFNREVGGECALYWTKAKGSLAGCISRAEGLSQEELDRYGSSAKTRISDKYSWSSIVGRYEDLFYEIGSSGGRENHRQMLSTRRRKEQHARVRVTPANR